MDARLKGVMHAPKKRHDARTGFVRYRQAGDRLVIGDGSLTRSPGLKLLVIIVLTAMMAVPLFLIQWALSSRESTANDAAQDIASGWGGPQTVAGPMLFVPYTAMTTSLVNGNPIQEKQSFFAALLPESLDIKANVDNGVRWRGIFRVPIYRTDIALHAKFDRSSIAQFMPSGATPDWKSAFIAISVFDVHGVADNMVLQVNGHDFPFEPGLGDGAAAGVHVPIVVSPDGPDLDVRTRFVLRGSRELSFVALAKRTIANISSPWTSPSFFGPFLPSDRAIDGRGFRAHWTVPYLARGFGQSFTTASDAMPQILNSGFGVRFYQPVDHYQLVERSLKYAILFVALTYLIFYVLEIITNRRLHVIQYGLVGAAQVLFYLLLLSLTEHSGFAVAYLVASGATIALIGLYSLSVLASTLRSLILAGVLAALYGLLYIILNAEDYALLIGSGVLFAALATTMYLTRNIDWYRTAPAQT